MVGPKLKRNFSIIIPSEKCPKLIEFKSNQLEAFTALASGETDGRYVPLIRTMKSINNQRMNKHNNQDSLPLT